MVENIYRTFLNRILIDTTCRATALAAQEVSKPIFFVRNYRCRLHSFVHDDRR
jgi:hypothetical protein